MAKRDNPQIAVIGLGAFGLALVKTLTREGANVIAIDNNLDHLDEIKHMTVNAICFDATDAAQLKAHGITDVDIAVISIGERFEPVVLVAMELINAGVKEVYGRANSETQEQILKRIGVNEIIHPERQVAEKMGITLHRRGAKDLLELGHGLSVFEMDIPKSMIGYTLAELNLRSRYGVNILTIKRLETSPENQEEYHPIGVPDGTTKLEKDDKFVLMGNKRDFDKIRELN